MRYLRSAYYVATLLVAGGLTSNALGEDKPTYGWVETATLEPWGAEVKVKLDTGALTSSMQAEEIETFKRDGEDWVRFNVEVEDEETDEVVSKTFERAVFRDLVVSGAGGTDHRPVVLMTICMGKTLNEEQFSLEDRDDMNYPVLLGRRTIQSLGQVDVTRTFEHDPDCDESSELVRHSDHDYDEDIGI
ncbi:ATP-dependent zinc protease [Vreelandella titanicae]|uniref:retropepsin-like aspartic peptidase RloA3 n=1 Tax=Vreelandella titanicae TaxID=664683 RepID=UPI001593A291|nr:RimK/LysX family protein [Halomonas titanicae]NVE90730.1 ATP-dependent zinc protease [Halomonas titanicae]